MTTPPKPLTPPSSAKRPVAIHHKERPAEPGGGFVTLDGEEYYRISACHRMPPFLMSIATDTDLWMFITSRGGLTAGRVDADGSLFPYETVDKLFDGHLHTGPVTLVRATDGTGRPVLWQPFAEGDGPPLERNLYKNTTGARVVFEEIHHGLNLRFRARWAAADELGWVRTVILENLGGSTVPLTLLDGLRNVLPYGAPLALYQQSSCLVDAYKRSDLDPGTRMGIFSLTSRIVDRAEAAEQLRANTVWTHGLDRFDVRLSSEAVAAFRRGEAVPPDAPLTGQRGNYLVLSSLDLEPGDGAKWHVAGDVGRSHVEIEALRSVLAADGDLDGMIEERLRQAQANLRRIVASADGVQRTGRRETSAHHFANVLFNVMRGGVFAHDYDIPREDLLDFLETRNRPAAERHRDRLAGLPERTTLGALLETAEATGDGELLRLVHEYLPLWFSRRHGDPSRPWNRFSIRVRDGDGDRAFHYEGNWRDIFQNWEALGLSFPRFLPGFIAKFVNASTVDGFNPYRMTRDGVDWEVEDPDDPWSYIGYWGDHQIIYLLKFLEAVSRYAPGTLEGLLDRDIFCYADVPYRIKPYADILEDPHATIVYDPDWAARIEKRVEALGTDGRLRPGADGSVLHVNLVEKLLVPVLAKLSNLVPGGGIWMNTQRPEWNDANNALVGHGISMVTLGYLRRHLAFLAGLFEARGDAAVPVSAEVARWLRSVGAILEENRPSLETGALDDAARKGIMDALGGVFSDYRRAVYDSGLDERTEVPLGEAADFCRLALGYLDHALAANRRDDGLFHSYNLLEVSPDGDRAAVRPLYEMLEGQVSALSSGMVDASGAVRLLDRLFAGSLYRPDQKSFLLYPERELPSFLERNRVPEERVREVPLLTALLEAGDTSVLARDARGTYRFHGDFANADDVEKALDRLARRDDWAEAAVRDRAAVLALFEEVFHHHAFTGRSGAMYAYEGLGSIYWHMVAKLLLAVQEIVLDAGNASEPVPEREDLMGFYFRIRSGLGYERSAVDYGAFPTDPYSHTPSHAGAQQPGMTGQVKEEILTRFGELGVAVDAGRVGFCPVLLRREEFLDEPGAYTVHDAAGRPRTLDLPAGALAFSFCGVPVVYHLTRDETWVRVTGVDGTSHRMEGNRLTPEWSRELFDRSGRLARIDVGVPERALRRD